VLFFIRWVNESLYTVTFNRVGEYNSTTIHECPHIIQYAVVRENLRVALIANCAWGEHPEPLGGNAWGCCLVVCYAWGKHPEPLGGNAWGCCL